MDRYDLYNFVKEFNSMGIVSKSAIMEGLKSLPEQDHELFMTLVNYKNSSDFKNKLQNGEI